MAYEVELKYPVEDLDQLRRQLLAMGAKPMTKKRQEDRYFNHPVRDFAETDEAVRLRKDGDEACITYKGKKIDAETKTRKEIEIKFADGPEVLDQADELLHTLGFRPVRTVAKTRECFDLDWRGLDVEASLDRVDGVGSFVEFEACANDDDLDLVRNGILQLARSLGFSNSERRSYLQLLLEKQS